MIYTRFGSPVKVIGVNGDWVKVERIDDGAIRVWAKSEFRADGGIKELEHELAKAPKITLSKGL